MTNLYIEMILHMRIAVYEAGVMAGLWPDLNDNGAKDMMDYIFPKSSRLAYYNLLLAQMRSNHDEIQGGVYYLFKLPVQLEKELIDYLKSSEIDLVSLKENAEAYLASMNTIATDPSFGTVNVGILKPDNLEEIMHLCASHYLRAFQNKNKSFPYFD